MGMLIEWSENLRIGVGSIDAQHEEFIRRANAFLEACKQRRGQESVVEQLDFLKEYTHFHFHAEERMHRQYGFPTPGDHHTVHEGFIADLELLRKRILETGPSSSIVIETCQMVVEWILRHVTSEVKVARELLAQGKLKISPNA